VAEMMGGLKTITDSNGNVTFEDSRVFFGRDKMSLGLIVTAFNTTNDLVYKASLKAALGGDTSTTTTFSAAGTSPAITETATLKPGAQPGAEILIPTRISMLELGFAPTFYQFVDTIIEVKISIRYSQEGSRTVETQTNNKQSSFGINRVGFARGVRVGRSVTTSQVNASYSQKYSYSAEGSSLLRTKLVPIPPPAILEERIRKQMELLNEKPATA
jgi:hypothetical protein